MPSSAAARSWSPSSPASPTFAYKLGVFPDGGYVPITSDPLGWFEHMLLRASIIPIVALWGLDFAAAIGGGAILTESVFNLHGVGQYAAQSIGALDVPPVLVIVILFAVLDPRIRLT